MVVRTRRAGGGEGERARVSSLCEVEASILEKHWGAFDLARMMERCALSCCVEDDEDGLVGFASFHHAPLVGDFKPSMWIEDVKRMWNVNAGEDDDIDYSNTLVLNFFHSEHAYEEVALNEVLKMAFNTFPQVEHVLLFVPINIPLFKPLLGNFEPLVLQADVKANYGCYHVKLKEVVGEVVVRLAMVEDHDDLMPIFKAQNEDADAYGEFFLAQMIQSQDDTNKALVVELNGKAVGILGVTGDMSLAALQEAFELETYDYLVQGYEEAAVKLHEDHVAREKMRREEHERQVREMLEEARRAAREEVEEEYSQMMDERADKQAEEDADKTEEELEAEEKEREEMFEQELAHRVAIAEEEALMEIGEFLEHPEPSVDLESLSSNAVCITLFCLDPRLDSQVHKVLEPALDLFPDKEYCILTKRHTVKQSSLIHLFHPVPEKLGCNFSHALYICHRACLLRAMQVSKAGEAEVEEISEFLEGEGSREEVLSFLQGAGKEETVFVARLEGQISGIAVVSPSKQPAVFSKWFELEQFMSPELYGSDEHLELLHLLVNPIFLRRVPEILRELLRITESFCLHAAVQDAQAMPRAYQTLTYIPCRRLAPSSPPKDLDPAKTALEPDLPLPAGPPALLHTNFRLLSQPKKDLDDRIVVIGGCETSVGFADAVLSVPYLDLHRVTYVSPGGLALRPPLYKRRSLTLSDAEYRQHAISRGCRVVEGTVSQLDRVEQVVSVRMDSGETVEIKYDHLVLAAGFRDTVIDRLQLWHVDGVFSPFNLYQENALQAWLEKQPSLKDVSAVIFGSSLDVFASARQLQEAGVAGGITIACPHQELRPTGEERVDELVVAAAERSGIKLKRGCGIREVEQRGQRVSAVITQEEESLPCSLLILHGERGVDQDLFSAINDQSLVFDGRLVVDVAFKTNDPKIIAGGEMVKFARRFQDNRKMDQFNPFEMGQRLAEALLVEVDPDAIAQERSVSQRVAPFVRPCSEAASLPGGLHYYRFWCSPALFPLGYTDDMISRDVVTDIKEPQLSYTRVEVDKYGRMSSLTMLCEEETQQAWRFAGLVGQSVSYLNDLVNRCDVGLVKDIRTFLLEDWANALFHDRFSSLRQQMETAAETSEHMTALIETLWRRVKNGDISASEVGLTDTALTGDTRTVVQDGLNNFLELNSNHLNIYLTAARSYDIQSNNIWAQTADKVGLVVGDVPDMDNTL